jgi:microcystin-dependent protein
MVNAGQGPGLSNYVQGQAGGEEAHTLIQSELPAHNHVFQASTTVATATAPTNKVYGQSASGNLYGDNGTATMAANAIAAAGGGQAHNNMMPFTTLNCIIALQGIFPARP